MTEPPSTNDGLYEVIEAPELDDVFSKSIVGVLKSVAMVSESTLEHAHILCSFPFDALRCFYAFAKLGGMPLSILLVPSSSGYSLAKTLNNIILGWRTHIAHTLCIIKFESSGLLRVRFCD